MITFHRGEEEEFLLCWRGLVCEMGSCRTSWDLSFNFDGYRLLISNSSRLISTTSIFITCGRSGMIFFGIWGCCSLEYDSPFIFPVFITISPLFGIDPPLLQKFLPFLYFSSPLRIPLDNLSCVIPQVSNGWCLHHDSSPFCDPHHVCPSSELKIEKTNEY